SDFLSSMTGPAARAARRRSGLERVPQLQEDLGPLGAMSDVESEPHRVPRLPPETKPVAALRAAEAEAGVVPGLARVVERGQLVSRGDLEAVLRRQREHLVAAETEARIAPHRERAPERVLEVEGDAAARVGEALGGQEAQ